MQNINGKKKQRYLGGPSKAALRGPSWRRQKRKCSRLQEKRDCFPASGRVLMQKAHLKPAEDVGIVSEGMRKIKETDPRIFQCNWVNWEHPSERRKTRVV